MPLVVEETKEYPSSFEQFQRDYILSRKTSTKHVHLQKEAIYPLVEPLILDGVIVEGDMLGMILALKYTDDDITNENKFPKLVPNKFLMKFISPKTHMIIIKPHVWDRGFQKEGLLNLFNIMHFGWSQEINACVKMILSCVHEGYMWLDKTISIYNNLIVHITSLSSQGKDLTSLVFDKNNEKYLTESMKEKFLTFHG
jgi:hypothetical protein